LTVATLAASLRAGELSPREAVQSYLDRIERLGGALNAYISVRADEALAEADALPEAGRAAADQPLWGVPLAVKDVIDVAGAVTTANSYVRSGAAPAARDAFVVERLRQAGAIVLGKLNTHEFAYGAMTTSPRFGPAHNPWGLDRICGGSSGGSGAAAAAGLAAGTLGTDTAGSIRIPASFNGVSGLRPTTGRVSNRGVLPVASTFDTVGPIARSVEDCAMLLEAIAGHDRADPSTVDVPVPAYSRLLGGGIRGLRVGVVASLLEHGVDARVAATVREALDVLRTAGAVLRDVEIPLFEELGTIQQAIQFPEATQAHLELLRTRLPDYGDDVRARLLTGLFLPSSVYVLGQRARRLAHDALRDVFGGVDLLAAPTMPILPPRIGEETVDLNGESVPYRLTLIRFNSAWSVCGLPAISVPCGFVDDLPVGLALAGWRFDEATVLRAGHDFQLATDWHDRLPPVVRPPAG
jgi:aspartyl-tRNA(Asn)/glutamyl-tRNA(Gln) amidotransferase subunit A